ncbi:UNKNOWN [Stylonychia lemnae]|uniref:Autophagy-related protein n=1 Tax=Stylonychia lemnae TaxID=5949 RepID=A0A078AK42_STYLE|nr:UNKNOWN [Stylonychia lemnae]|eukprot:CDW82266.1 UNKNOWN [Stylonychia lemnae]
MDQKMFFLVLEPAQTKTFQKLPRLQKRRLFKDQKEAVTIGEILAYIRKQLNKSKYTSLIIYALDYIYDNKGLLTDKKDGHLYLVYSQEDIFG